MTAERLSRGSGDARASLESPPVSLSSQVARNTLLNLGAQGAPLVVALIAIPLVVRVLGPARFGVLGLVWGLLWYFSVFDLGLGRATTRFVADALGRRAPGEIGQILGTSLAIQGSFGVLVGMLLTLAAQFLSSHVFRIPATLVVETRNSLLLLAAVVPAVMATGSVRGTIEAAQRFDLVNAVKIPVSTMNFLLPLVALLWGPSLTRIVLLLVFVRYAALVSYAIMVQRVIRGAAVRLVVRRAAAIRLVRFGSWIAVSSVLNPMLVYGDRFVLGAMVGMTAVAVYVAPYEMITRLWAVPASLVSSLFPALTSLNATAERETVAVLMLRWVKLMSVAVGAIAILLAAFAHDLMRVWLGSAYVPQGAVVLQVLALGVMVNSLAQILHSTAIALGRPDVPTKLHLLELPIHLFLLWVLVGNWGVVGAAAAWSVRAGLDAVLIVVMVERTLGLEWLGPRSSLRVVAGAAATFGIIVGGGALATGLWFRILIVGVLLTAVLAAAWFRVFEDGDRCTATGILRAIGTRSR